jgi:predicted alpha/beta superfamily hydrolase
MKKILALTLVLFIAVSCKKKVSEPEFVRTFTVEATGYSAAYVIKVALPLNYDPQKKYPTLYILDGDENFDFVADKCNKLSQKYATNNALVISIGYGRNRAMDYTPTKADQGDGGAPEFMNFIETDLIPRVEKEVSADTTRSSRVILGHSFGGLFAAYAFSKQNQVFGNYIMLSPSLWYDDEVLLQYEGENREHMKDKKQLVFLGIGELENAGRMQAPFEAFYQRLLKYGSGMKLLKNSVPYLDHVGSKNPNIELALDFYFQNK